MPSPIDFPNSPSNGDFYTADGKTWQFNGTSWNLLVGTANIGDGTVTTAKIADGAVTAEKLAPGAGGTSATDFPSVFLLMGA